MHRSRAAIIAALVMLFGVYSCSSDSSAKFVAGANLTDENLVGRDLSGLDLSGANLTGADLTGANLNNTDLRGANLTRVNLTDATLVGSDLSGANLSGAKLDGADFTDATLEGLRTGGTSLEGVKGIPTTTIPPTTSLPPTTTPATTEPRPSGEGQTGVQNPPNTSAAPVYLTRTEVRTVYKILPDGPWECRRTYVYSDGNRTYEDFESPTECSQ